MKIYYDIDNFFRCYNEALSVFLNKNKVLKGKKVISYFDKGIIYLVCTIILFIFKILLSKFIEINSLNYLLILIVFLLVWYFLILTLGYIKVKDNNKGYITLTEDGIKSMGIYTSYSDIEFIYKGKYSITIITKNRVIYFINKEKEELINEIIKNKKDILVIYDI